MVWSLVDAGAAGVTIVNRSQDRARALAAAMAAVARPWEERDDAVAEADLVVNTTSLGMEGQAPLAVDLSGLPGDAVVTDLVYTPLETALLAAARARGNRVVDGLGMLLHQARPGFAAWFGVEPAVDADLRAAVLGSEP